MNIIAIVGRPNVGKSTLFNRLTESRNAIVDETAGVTRDRQYGHSDWTGNRFSVLDTGGYVMGGDDEFEVEIRKQVSLAIDEADVILFLVDAREGLTPMDEDVAEMLRKCPKPVVLAANKVDNSAQMDTLAEFYSLGLGDPFPIAGVTGSGTGDLLDALVKDFDSGEDDPTDGLPRIAVVGRPNVGKSSFINMITGEHRSVVTPIAGTTRDSVYSHYNLFGFDFNFVDTAGLRRKAKVSEDLEFYSVMRSIRAIEASDVCILMLDASQGLEQQDLNIFSLIQRNHKGVVIVVNKWDLVQKETNTHRDYEKLIRERIAPFDDVPIVLSSASSKCWKPPSRSTKPAPAASPPPNSTTPSCLSSRSRTLRLRSRANGSRSNTSPSSPRPTPSSFSSATFHSMSATPTNASSRTACASCGTSTASP